ncbi:MAG: hypothetical protein MUC49_22810 [Raineya sp.]|jgi:hypothetical protein|nr:hypothetical protein [Raineya sp.]
MAKHNFENLYFDITKFGDKKKVYDVYPELLPFKNFHKISSLEWKIAVLFIDIGSPFVKINDVYQKTEEIFKYLELNKRTTHFKIFEDIVNYKQSDIIDLFTFLIEYFNNHEFAAWFGKNKLYYELTRVIDKPLSQGENYDRELDRKLNLQAKQKAMLKDLKELETNLFGTTAMKADVAYKSKVRIHNWNEKFADENQVE